MKSSSIWLFCIAICFCFIYACFCSIMAGSFYNCHSLIYLFELLCFNQFVTLFITTNFFLDEFMFWFHILLTIFLRVSFLRSWNFDLQAYFELKCFCCYLFSVCFFPLFLPCVYFFKSLVLWLSLYMTPWNSISEPDALKAVQGSWPQWCQRYLRSPGQYVAWFFSCFQDWICVLLSP